MESSSLPLTSSLRTCPACHVEVRPTDFFCYNCGKELSEAATPVKVIDMVGVLLGSVLLPPLGILWGFKYLRKNDRTTKLVGVAAIVLTVMVLWLALSYTQKLITTVNQQFNSNILNLETF